MEIKGKVISISEIVEFGEKNTQKRSFTIEYGDGQYTDTICIDCIADKVSLLNMVSVGEEVIAHVNTRAKEHNGRVYNSIRCRRIENMTRKAKPVVSNDEDDSGLPF